MRTYTPAQIRPYAEAIGSFSIAFNDLHESLGLLFAMAGNSHNPTDTMQYMQMQAIWGCADSERTKRLMLQASVDRLAPQFKYWREVKTDVPWIIKSANSLETQRNNVLHAPLHDQAYSYFAWMRNQAKGEISPATTMLNRRALLLQEAVGPKPLLGEIRKYRAYARGLTGFVLDVFHAWQFAPPTWPRRPKLPPLSKNG